MARVYDGKVVIVGAGSAGISIAARLLRKNRQLYGQVLLIDPSDKHYYQPLWTLVGGGAAKAEDSVREQASLIPEGAKWLKEAVDTFMPEHNTLKTREGSEVRYDYLVVAAGIEIYWDQIKGLKETIGKTEFAATIPMITCKAHGRTSVTSVAVQRFLPNRAHR